ncbi:Wzz/FepE/Etk N-terminal domain-containing protein [Kitasatospora sp. NPDC127116]|uniref:Wzz/FepE/Etk N-terminal domain-containing protein n=1 Tax=Kitasatospora sp. NPDC127116 TaxID=3345367 RepID=UPI00363F436D
MTTPRRSARRLVRRWWPVVLAVPLGAAAGAGYAVVSPPSYAANAYVLVVAQNPGEAAIATNFAQAYGRLAGQPQVLAVAAAETGHTRSELESLVHGTTSPDAPMIELTGTGRRPQEAARTADAVARSLVAFANTSSKDTNVRLVTLSPAAAPDRPTTPSGKLDVAVGGAAGLLLGALVMMNRRRGGAGTPEAGGSPEMPRVLRAARASQAAQAVQAAQGSEAPAASAPVAVPTTPRPRREEPAKARTASGGDSAPGADAGAEAEGVKAGSVKAESVAAGNVKAGNVKAGNVTAGSVTAGNVTAGSVTAESVKKGSTKAEKKTVGKPGRKPGAGAAAAEQPPAEDRTPAVEEQPSAVEQQAPAVEDRPATRAKAPAGSGR